jgi:hypothetical protein
MLALAREVLERFDNNADAAQAICRNDWSIMVSFERL